MNYTEIANYEERVIPTRFYRFQIGIEIPLGNIQNLEKMLEYFSGRLRQKLDIGSLRIEKIIISEAEQSEILIYFSLNRSEARSVWSVWKLIDQELAPVGKATIISAYSQAPQLPVQLGQAEVGIIESIKRFVNDWHGLIEIFLFLIIIGILLSQKKE